MSSTFGTIESSHPHSLPYLFSSSIDLSVSLLLSVCLARCMGMSVIFKFCVSDHYNRHYLGGGYLLNSVSLMNENIPVLMFDRGISTDMMTFPCMEQIGVWL